MTNPVGSDTDLERLHEYGDHAAKIEPGGIERIPETERHGKPWHLFATWTSPNLEFATVFLGVLGVAAFGLSFWMTVLAVVIGNALGGITHAVVSSWGGRHGLAQMVLSRTGFGYWGNLVPAGLNTVMAGVGWFAVNSISGTYAINSLTGIPTQVALALVIVAQLVIAFIGHNLIQLFERIAFPLLVVVFLLASISIFMHADLSAPATADGSNLGGFLIMVAAAFGYTAGWNPYGADYTRYLPKGDSKAAGLFAGLGDFVSCTVLMIVGAAAVTIPGITSDWFGAPTDAFTETMPGWIKALTLLAIALGAISANVLNIYSGAMSALALGIKLSYTFRRGIVAVVAGVFGGIVAYRFLNDVGAYENWLLIIAYWIAPWLGVVLVDRILRKGDSDDDITAIAESESYVNWAGPIAMVVGMVISIWLFSNQVQYVGPVASAYPSVGDITPLVGFILSAGIYYGLFTVLKPSRTAA